MTLGRDGRDERGSTAVIVAISLTAIFSAAVLSIDAGSLWRTRRELITNTDAGALAAARLLDAQGAKACDAAAKASAQAEATAIVAANDARTSVTGFTVTPTNNNCSALSGHVRLDATLPAATTFAGALGVGQLNAASTSITQWGPLTGISGLRPIGICDKSPAFAGWTRYVNGLEPNWGHLSGQRLGPNGQVINTVMFQQASTGCGYASGNWDWLDFNGTIPPNGVNELRDTLLNGYPGTITLADAATGVLANCNPERPGAQPYCEPKTGATGNSTSDALAYLRDTGTVFPIIVYDRVVDRRDPQACASTNWTGSGANARFCHVAFLLVRLWGWDKITGNGGSFDFEFVDQWWVGSIGRDPSGGRPTAHGVSLCGGGYATSIDMHCDV
ncbi:MAG: hypothetical protein NVSMB57_09560 [Actinomycetota bacterium]